MRAAGALGPDGDLTGYCTTDASGAPSAPGGYVGFDVPGTAAGGTSGILSTVGNFVNDPLFGEVIGPAYAFYTGTSMAAPHVSGVAALVLAANPGMTGPQPRDRPTSTAVDIGPPGFDTRTGDVPADAHQAATRPPGPAWEGHADEVE